MRPVFARPHGRLAPVVQTSTRLLAQRNTTAILSGISVPSILLIAGTRLAGIGRGVSSVPTRAQVADGVSACADGALHVEIASSTTKVSNSGLWTCVESPCSVRWLAVFKRWPEGVRSAARLWIGACVRSGYGKMPVFTVITQIQLRYWDIPRGYGSFG